MDVRDRALLDLQSVLDVKPPTKPRFDPQEASYLEFKSRVGKLLKESLGDDYQDFLQKIFLNFLPPLLRAAGEHENLHKVECEEEIKQIDEVFDRDLHHLSHSPMVFPLNRQVFRSVAPASPSLDLGVGPGQNSSYTMHGRKLDVGSDIMVSNLIKARARKSHENFAALDMGNVPFADNTFQRVYALNCLYHVQLGRKKALEEISRVLAPGGQVAITDVSPYLNDFKPLRGFFESMGFTKLSEEFSRYFLAGFGADGTPGSEEFYTDALLELGFENIHIRYIMSPRLSRLSYLFYDWQALFNMDAQAGLKDGPDKEHLMKVYRATLNKVVAPLLRLDEEICSREKRGGYIFVTAQKRGTSKPIPKFDWREHLICPVSKAPLVEKDGHFHCEKSDMTYPVVDGIPLLTDFYSANVELAEAVNAAAATNNGKAKKTASKN